MLLDLSVDALITILTILSIFVLLLVTKLPADFVFLGGITVLLMTGVLVYGPGGYRFADFIRIGLPMNLIMLAANIFITTLLFPL